MDILLLTTSKIFVTTLTIVTLLFSGLSSYREMNFFPVDIDFKQTSLVMSFSNGQYLVIRPEAEIIDDGVSATIRPFQTNDKFENYTQGFDLAWFSKTDIQNLKSGNNLRTLTIQRKSSTMFQLNYKIETNYVLSNKFNYQIQIDYSRISEIISAEDSIKLKDLNCTFTIYKNPSFTVSDFGNNKSLVIKQTYAKSLSFVIDLGIECK